MKEIKAVVQPARLPRIREAVRSMPDFPGMTVSKAEGSGYHPDKPNPPGIKTELTDYSPKVRLEIVSPDDKVAAIVQLIEDACRTGRPGDGIVWVTDVESFHRIREG
jgi:nitrogen regulatory protein P-II 1